MSSVVPVQGATLAVKSFPLEISTALSFYAGELRWWQMKAKWIIFMVVEKNGGSLRKISFLSFLVIAKKQLVLQSRRLVFSLISHNFRLNGI